MSDNNVNLTDYILERAYGKEDSYSKEQINELLNVIKEKDFELFEIVATLPTTDIKTNRIYLVYNVDGDSGNLFDVYIWIGNDWEQLDGSGFNLNDFYTKFQLDNILYGKASKTDLNTLRNNLTDTRDSLTSLYDNLTEFNSVLIDFDTSNTNLDTDLEKLKDNLDGFITRVNGLISSLDTLTVDMSKAQIDLTNAKADLNDLKTDINGDENDSNKKGLKNELHDLSDSLTNTSNGLNTARTQIISLQSQSQSFTERLDDFDDDLSEAKEDLLEAQDEITGLKSKDTELTEGLGVLTDSLTETNSSLNTTSGLLIGLKSDFDDLTDEYESTKTVLNTTKATVQALQETTEEFHDQLEELDEGLDEAKTSISNTETEIATLKSKDTELTGQLNTLTGELNTTKDNLTITGNTLSGLKDDFDDLSDEFDESKTVLQTATGNITTLTTATENLSSTINRVDGDLTEAKSSLETTKNGLKEVHDELLGVNGNGGLKKDLTDLSASMDSFEDEIDGLQEADAGLRTSINGLSTELNGDGTEQNTGLRGELSGLQTANNGLRTDVQKLQSDTSAMSVNLGKLWDGLTDASGELMVSGEDIVIFSQELDSFLSDLNTLGGYLTNFEGSLTEFKQELTDNEVTFETFELESNIVALFGSIGIVKSDVSGLQDTADTIQEDIDGVNTALYGSPNGDSNNYTSSSLFGNIDDVQDGIEEINTVTIPSVNDSIEEVDGKVTTTNARIDGVDERIDGVDTDISRVGTKIESVNTIIGDENNPSSNSLRGQIGAVDTRVDRVDGILGDENSGLISDVNQSIDKIETITNDEGTGSLDNLQDELYGGENYSFDNEAEGSYINLLKNTNNQLVNETIPQLDANTAKIDVVDGKVDDAQAQLDTSLESIETVNELLNGKGILREINATTSGATLTIDTTEITTECVLKIFTNDINELTVTLDNLTTNGNISANYQEIVQDYNLDFSNIESPELSHWIISNEEKITIGSQKLILDNRTNVDGGLWISEVIDFQYFNSISYTVKKRDNTDGKLKIFIGEEGVLDNLLNFQYGLDKFEGTLNNLDNTVSGLDTQVDGIQETLDGDGTDENPGLITQTKTTIQGLGKANGRIDSAIAHTNAVEDKVDNAQAQLDESIGYITNVQKILYGDSTSYYPCDNTKFTEYTINTEDIDGVKNLKFIIYPKNEIMLHQVTNVTNGAFNGWTGWGRNPNNDELIQIINLDEEQKAVLFTAIDNTLILTQENINFANIDEIKFNIKYQDYQSNNTHGGLFVYIGDEDDDLGLMKNLSDFKDSLVHFNTTLDGIGEDVDGLITGVDGLQTELYGGDAINPETGEPYYSFDKPQEGSYIDTLNVTTDVLDTVTNEAGDGLLDNAINDIHDITNTDGTGSLDAFGEKLDGVTNGTDGTLDIAINDITTLQTDMSQVYNDVDNIQGMVYGDKRRITLTNVMKRYTLNTKKYTGQLYLTFEISGEGTLLIGNITYTDTVNNSNNLILNPSFANGTTDWTIETEQSSQYNHTTETVDENTIDCISVYNATNKTIIKQRINFTNIDSISFYSKVEAQTTPILNVIIYDGENDINTGLFGEIEVVQGDIYEVQGYVRTLNGQIPSLQSEIGQATQNINTATNNINGLLQTVGDASSGLVKEVADIKDSISDAEGELYGEGGDKTHASAGSIWYRINQIYNSDNNTGSLVDLENKVKTMDTLILPHTGKYIECYVAEQQPSLTTLQSVSEETGYNISNIKYWKDNSTHESYYELVNSRWVARSLSNLPNNIIGIYYAIKNKDTCNGDETFTLAYSITTDKYYEMDDDYYA